MNTYKLGSLFDGSGGFPLAGFMCNIVPVWAAEIEPYPIAVTKSRFPYMKHLGDVSKINGAEIEPVDIITFGSPCQDLSVAGKRAGLKHTENGDEETTRSGLFMEAVRIIKEMREATNGKYPRFALWENVPGAFSSNKGEDFRIVLEELIKIDEPTATMPEVPKNGWPYADSYCGDGWSLAYRVLDAQFWGVPQRRRRIYLVADFRGECAREILFEREGLRGYFAEGRTPWQTTPGNAENGLGAADCERNSVIAIDQGDGKSGANFHDDLSPTLTCTHGGEPAAVCPYTLKIRSGCEGGGKGALIQTDKSATLATNNDQYLFQPVVYSFDSLSSNSMKSSNPHSGCRAVETSKTLDTTDPNPSKNQGGIAVLEPVVCYDARGNGDGTIAPTITDDHNNRVTDYTCVCCEPIPIHDQAIRFSGKHGDRHTVAYAMQAFGKYEESETASAMKARDYKDATDLIVEETPVALDRAFYNQGVNAQYDPQLYVDGTCPTLVARGPAAVCVRYIVRRLTPTECARLQGFADHWGDIDYKDDFSDEEYRFWLDVRNTYAEINGKAVKDYAKTQMLAWYNKLRTDSSEYKMWGNGIALPTALYVMQGIAEALK